MPHKTKVRIRALKASRQGMVGKCSKREAIKVIVQPALVIEAKACPNFASKFKCVLRTTGNAKVIEVRSRLSDASPELVHVNQRTKGRNAAKMYGEKYQSELRFLRCGCCLREESSSKFVEISKVKENDILMHLRQMKKYFLVNLRQTEASSYEKNYSHAYELFLNEDGIDASARYLCLECYRDLKKVLLFKFIYRYNIKQFIINFFSSE